MRRCTSIEVCAGAGGQALGLEQAGFKHLALIEIDRDACKTLRMNRPGWNVLEDDVHNFSGDKYNGVDLVAGGVPCPPFSIAGKQLGACDERDLFPEALRIVEEVKPKAVMLENVRGLADKKFARYRANIVQQLDKMGYRADWRLLNASDYGVPQLRPRFILIALKPRYAKKFKWPRPSKNIRTVGDMLKTIMGSNGWKGTEEWAKRARGIAPTIVGGSKKHGGPDLGPTRARRQWLELGVDGRGIVNTSPTSDFPLDKNPRLTVQMVATLQGFPEDWRFAGGKTAAYRQVGNAFPPPVAAAVGKSIIEALSGGAEEAELQDGLSGLPLLELMERSRKKSKKQQTETPGRKKGTR